MTGADVVGQYADEAGPWTRRLELCADHQFRSTSDNRGFQGAQGSHETGTWRLLEPDLVELHVCERYDYYEDSEEGSSSRTPVDLRRRLEILRDGRGLVRAIAERDASSSELRRVDWPPPGNLKKLVARARGWWRAR
jgi:hypothetical protein